MCNWGPGLPHTTGKDIYLSILPVSDITFLTQNLQSLRIYNLMKRTTQLYIYMRLGSFTKCIRLLIKFHFKYI